MAVSPILMGFDRSVGEAAERLELFLRRPGALPVLIILLWACAVLPNLTVRSFIYEEGTNAEIARDALSNGHFLTSRSSTEFAGTKSRRCWAGLSPALRSSPVG